MELVDFVYSSLYNSYKVKQFPVDFNRRECYVLNSFTEINWIFKVLNIGWFIPNAV